MSLEAKRRWDKVKGTPSPWQCDACEERVGMQHELEQLKAQIAAAGIGQVISSLISNATTAALTALRQLEERGAGAGATTTTTAQGGGAGAATATMEVQEDEEDAATVSAALAGLLDSSHSYPCMRS